MTTRWEVERAVLTSNLPPQERLLVLALLAMTDQHNAVIPAQYTPSLTRIQSMTGQSSATVKRALNALEKAGWVVRKRPDMAKARADKERTRYALKAPEAGLTQSLARPTESLELGSQRATGLGSQRATSHTPSHTDQNQQASTTSPEDRVREATGATADEATAIVKRIREERNPRSLDGFVKHLAASGDLRQYLADVRAAAARYADDNDRKIRQGMARCEHGVAGGTQPHTVTGLIRCGACRIRNRAARLGDGAQVIRLHAQEVS